MSTEALLAIANGIKTYGMAITTFVGIITFAATLCANKWQAEISSKKDEAFTATQSSANQAINKTIELDKITGALRNENAQLTERLAWRSLTTKSKQDAVQPLQGVATMLVITIGEMEASAFGAEVISALSKLGIVAQTISIGSISPPVYGVQFFEQNWNQTAANALKKAGVIATEAKIPLPVPLTLAATLPKMPAIIVGLRSPP